MKKVPIFERDYLIDLAARLRKPLKRKVSLRDSFLKKLREEGTRIHWNRNGHLKRKRPLKKVSRSQRTRYRSYQALAEAFLSLPENRLAPAPLWDVFPFAGTDGN